ncbi:MAG: hypothetical protein QXQ13_08080 [Thermoplasmata archaeon]
MPNIASPTPTLDNPFVYGGAVTGRAFFDRERELDELLMAVRGGRSAVVFSERRMGKSSLLAEFARRNADDYLFISLSMRGITEEGQFAELLAKKTLQASFPRFDDYLTGVMSLIESPSMRLALFDIKQFLQVAKMPMTGKGTLEEAAASSSERATCNKCGMPLKWIAAYSRFYCYTCKKYASTRMRPRHKLRAGFQLMQEVTCFECGGPLIYVDGVADYFCETCRKFPLVEQRAKLSQKHSREEVVRSLNLPAKLAEMRRQEVVVMIDDFQEVTSFDSKWLLSEMASRVPNQKMVHYIFAGGNSARMRTIFMERGSPMHRMAHPIDLRELPSDGLREFLMARFSSGGGKLTREVADRLASACGGHPYYTQQLAHELFHISHEPTLADVNLALAQMLDKHSATYSLMWESIRSPLHRRFLIGVASEPGARRGRDFIRRYALKSRSHVQRIEKQLSQRGIIVDGAVADPMLALWLKSLRPSES